MKKLIFALILPLMCSITFAQNAEEAEKYIEEGIAYHDKGDFEGAVSKYDKALELDKDNLYALGEKAMSLLSMKKYEESVQCCQLAVEKHPADAGLKMVYVIYGNSLDEMKKTDKSIEIYNEGIKLFPDYFQLHFNKGISLVSVKKYDDGLLCFQKAVVSNPNHGSSHNIMARILDGNHKRIPALLAYSRFLIIEPVSNRAKEDLENLKDILRGNVEKTGKKSMTINISPDMLGDTTEDGRPNENSFMSADLLLALSAGLDQDKKNKKETEVEQFMRKFETVCASLKESQNDNFGFYWDYYVPYFIELNEKKYMETFAYIVFASSEDPYVSKWLKSHKSEIESFYNWSEAYNWKAD